MAWTDKYVSVAGGGAHDGTSEANAWTLAEAIAAPYAAGQRINVKAGTYANTTTSITFGVAGTTTAPIWWRGYKTTIGDLDDGVTVARSLQDGVNLPLITFTTGQVIVSGKYHIFSNLDITSQCTTSFGAVNVSAAAPSGNQFYLCRIENTAANTAARSISIQGASAALIRCRLKTTNTATHNVYLGAVSVMAGCYVIGGDSSVYAASYVTLHKCVIESFGTNGVKCDAAANNQTILDCTIYAAATNAINISAIPTNGRVTIVNSILGGCTNGINAASATSGVFGYRNHFYGCTNNLVNIQEVSAYTDDLGVLQALMDDDNDPFVAKGSGDFSLASGAIDKSAGFPGIFEGQTAMVGYPDIGAVRHIDPTAGGGRPEFRGANL